MQNLNENKTVFILGAGFSHCAGLPLTKDLPILITEEVYNNAQAKTYIHIDKYLSPVEASKDKNYHTTLPGLYVKQVSMNNHKINFDSFINRCTSHPEDLSDDWKSVINDGYTNYGIIMECVSEAIKNILKQKPIKTDYIDNLVKFCHSTGSPIYTTNFDTLIEDSCIRIGYEPDVAATTSRRTTQPKANFRLHKINGSIDWNHIPKIRNTELNNYPVKFERNIQVSGWQKIALTSEDKLATMATALPSLFELHEDFRKCKKMIAIGTSFQDFHINSIIYSSLHRMDSEMLVVTTEEDFPININFLANSLNKSKNIVKHIRENASSYCKKFIIN